MNQHNESPRDNRPSLVDRAVAASFPENSGPLDNLNPAQRDAVETLEGPVLMLAGAGVGKTRALTARIAYLISTGTARSHEVLGVTFTNKAAHEMKDRVANMLGSSVGGLPWLGTFHHVCTKILRRHAELIGLDQSGVIGSASDLRVHLEPNFTILDSQDQQRLIKQVLELADISPKKLPPRYVATIINRWKNRALTPDKLSSAQRDEFDNRGHQIYTMYQRRLLDLNAVDFGDLILHCLSLFKTHDDVLTKYQRWFRYILVDEYQDTNVAQYLWLRLLAAAHHNICCVGDDDQSIYGWRGAEVSNILRFDKAFPNCKVIRLEQNYRSTPHILATASSIIRGNKHRLGKELWTEKKHGEKVQLVGHASDNDEAIWISDRIESLHSRQESENGYRLNDMAILVRAVFQMRVFEERFLSIGLPYRIIAGLRFYERLEVKDALSYFRLVSSPADDLAFDRIINTPKRGLGDKAQQTIREYSFEHGVSLLQASKMVLKGGHIKGRGAIELRKFCDQIDRWHMLMRDKNQSHVKVAETILDESGYTNMWQQEHSPEATGRIENLQELTRVMGEFENLQGFLEHTSLIMAHDDPATDDRVTIMTLHAAKGLEFPCVFLPGWEDGLFPSQRAMDETGIEGEEEERRLAYVGITRAEELCTISFSRNRFQYGTTSTRRPSRFIHELPEEHVNVVNSSRSPRNKTTHINPQGHIEMRAAEANVYNSPGWKRLQAKAETVHDLRSVNQSRHKRNAGERPDFIVGQRIFHRKFGYGSIQSIDRNKLQINFEKAGLKHIHDSFVFDSKNIPD